MESITNKELINQLSKFDENKKVFIYGIGINSLDSFKAPLTFEDLTVDEIDNDININFSLY